MKKWMIILLLLTLPLAGIWLFLQTHFAQKIASSYVSDALEQSGIQIHFNKIEGAIPHAISMQGVSLHSENFDLSIEQLKVDLSWLSLFQRKILINTLYAKGISWNIAPRQEGKEKEELLSQGFSRSIEVKRFRLDEIQSLPVQIDGSFLIGKKNRRMEANLEAKWDALPDAKLHLLFQIAKDGIIRLRGNLHAPLLLENSPLQSALDLRFFARGPKNGTLYGKANGTVATSEPLHIPFLIDAEPGIWKTDLRFQWALDQGWSISRLSLDEESQTILGEIQSTKNSKEIKEAHLQIGSNKETTHIFLQKEMQSGLYHVLLDGTQWQGQTDIAISKEGAIQLSSMQLKLRSAQIAGNLEIRKGTWTGAMDLNIGNLGDFPPALPALTDLYGSIQAHLDWSTSNGKQNLRLAGKARNLYWKEIFCETLDFNADLDSPWDQPQGFIALDASFCKWRQLSLESLLFQMRHTGLVWEYGAELEGRWKHPLALKLAGYASHQLDQLTWVLTQASGSFYHHPLALKEPVTFFYSPGQFHLSPLEIFLDQASLFCTLDHDEKKTEATCKLNRFPLDVLSLNPLDIPIQGVANGYLELHQSGKEVSGRFESEIQQLEIQDPETDTPTQASGICKGIFQKDRLDLTGNLHVGEKPFLNLNLSLPLHLNLHRLEAEFLYDGAVRGHLVFDGPLEEIADFMDLGMHRITGHLTSDLSLRNTLRHPVLEGDFNVQNGTYENYITGMQWNTLAINAKAKGDRIQIHFSALDQHQEGSITADGTVKLDPKKDFPFQFDVQLNQLQAAQIDLVSATIQGQLTLTGNRKQALAKGEIEVLNSLMHIPSHIPRLLPELAVVYKNASKPPPTIQLADRAPYPLYLDLNVKAPENIFIEGRGLNSSWKGDFHVGGTFTSMTAQGKLELIQGSFLFSGRSFRLIDGSLTFRGKEKEMPWIDIAAFMQVKDVSITTRLKGPLNQPQITLQSVPPLPMSTILAYLLFGQDMSEINSFQALQLANSLASIAGEGPDVMEKARKSLGVDRLQVVSVPTGDEELSETIALQVGKYVSEGILVSITQGAEDSSTNISIEVEMKHGFILQMESDQRQEQGKFTLKWAKSF